LYQFKINLVNEFLHSCTQKGNTNYLQTTSSEENFAGSGKGSEQYYGLSRVQQPKATPTAK